MVYLFLDSIVLYDFITTAMENWGLIVYRPRDFLYNANVSSDANKQGIAQVIMHEISHQVEKKEIYIYKKAFSLFKHSTLKNLAILDLNLHAYVYIGKLLFSLKEAILYNNV